MIQIQIVSRNREKKANGIKLSNCGVFDSKASNCYSIDNTSKRCSISHTQTILDFKLPNAILEFGQVLIVHTYLLHYTITQTKHHVVCNTHISSSEKHTSIGWKRKRTGSSLTIQQDNTLALKTIHKLQVCAMLRYQRRESRDWTRENRTTYI